MLWVGAQIFLLYIQRDMKFNDTESYRYVRHFDTEVDRQSDGFQSVLDYNRHEEAPAELDDPE